MSFLYAIVGYFEIVVIYHRDGDRHLPNGAITSIVSIVVRPEADACDLRR